MTQSIWADIEGISGGHVSGDGPPLVVAHGAGGGVELNFTDLADALGGRRQVIGRDYPGAGSRPRAEEPLRLEDLADGLVDAAVAAGHERFPILGLSLGSAVALTAASRHPDRVTALALTVGFPRADVLLSASVDLFHSVPPGGQARVLFVSTSSPTTLASIPAGGFEETYAAVEATIPPGAADQLALAASVDVVDIAKATSVPTLVIAAGQDHLVLPSSTRELAAIIPGATLLEYPDAGHVFTPDEARTWAGDVDAFLRPVR